MFELASPKALWLVFLPLLLWILLPTSKLNHQSALYLPFYQRLTEALSRTTTPLPRRTVLYFYGLFSLLVVALAGPQWVGNPMPLSRHGHNILLVLDLSGSMEIPDMNQQGYPVSRLMVVKQAANAFVKARTMDRIGLILFASEAYLQTPLTYDHENVLTRIQEATVGLAGKTTSIGDALGLAVKTLQHTPKKGRIIILLTDGANNSGVLEPLKAAELAKDEHIKVYTIGLASQGSHAGLTHMFLSMQAGADLDEDTLKSIAKETGGRYFRATNPASLHHIYRTIDLLETVKQSAETARPKIDYYPWLLLLFFLGLGGWLLWIVGPKLNISGRSNS